MQKMHSGNSNTLSTILGEIQQHLGGTTSPLVSLVNNYFTKQQGLNNQTLVKEHIAALNKACKNKEDVFIRGELNVQNFKMYSRKMDVAVLNQ